MLFYVVRAGLAWRADPGAVRGLIGLYARPRRGCSPWWWSPAWSPPWCWCSRLGDLLTTGYGRVLLIKAGLVAAAHALAVAGRLWLRRRRRRGPGRRWPQG